MGLPALVEHMRLVESPGTGLGDYRKALPNAADHDHIRFVAEVLKHIERNREGSPRTLDEMETRTAGAFSPAEFSRDFDIARDQLGFPFQATRGDPATTWVPLREVVVRCIDYWQARFGS